MNVEMKCVAFNMTPKSNFKICNGNNRYPFDSNKARMSTSQMKTIFTTFFDIKGTVHFVFIPQGHTINTGIFKRSREAVPRKGPELCLNVWILHHDNDPAHRTLSVTQFLAQKMITEM
jgi:hypothetical protein